MRTKFPHTLFLAAGSQGIISLLTPIASLFYFATLSIHPHIQPPADRPKNNKIYIMKISDIHQTRQDADEDADAIDLEGGEDDEALDDDPIVEWREVPVYGSINRVRCMCPNFEFELSNLSQLLSLLLFFLLFLALCLSEGLPQRPSVIAGWSDAGKVHLWDVKQELNGLSYYGVEAAASSSSSSSKGKGKGKKKGIMNQPIHTFEGHGGEGYALDWSPLTAGSLLSGDVRGMVFHWVSQAGKFVVESEPFCGHNGRCNSFYGFFLDILLF